MGIPDELMARGQWVCWRYEERRGRPTKVPVNARTGAPARTNDPSTWASYDEALASVTRHKCAGLGFVFTREDPYVGIDLDHCIDESGALSRRAQEIFAAFSTYTEVSPSGRGLHCILRGSVPSRAAHSAVLDGQPVEVYSEGRYFCMTGEVWS